MTFEEFKKEAFANDPELKREYDLLKEVRLIDANTFDVTYNRDPEWEEDYSEGFDDGVLYTLGKLDDAETIDAVQVVRCKDCKHSEERIAICKPHDKFVICNNKQAPTNHRWFDLDDYCSYGERKK